MTRRAALGFAGACCVAAAAGYSTLIEPDWLEVTEHDVAIPGLPARLAGFKIAQLSDLHLNALGSLHERVLQVIAELAPQLVVLTGDVIESARAQPLAAELCAGLRARGRSLIATLGNWEHWGGVPIAELRRMYGQAGTRLLGNESIAVGDGLVAVATDDYCTGHADLSRACAALPSGEVRLLLTHAPGVLEHLPRAGPRFALALAGHTHGGQLCAGGKAIWVPPGSGHFRHGMYRTECGPAYVSRGIGTSVIPARFTCRPELPVFRLVPE